MRLIKVTRCVPVGLSVALGSLLFVNVDVTLAQSLSFNEATGSPIATGTRPSSVVTADFNSDGFLDVAVVNANANSVSVFLGYGDGTFRAAPHSAFTVNGGVLGNGVPIAAAAGDFNGDGRVDLAVTNIPLDPLSALGGAITGHVGGGVGVFLGVGDGSFQPTNNFGTGGDLPVSIAVGDFNKDGKPDFAIANLNSGNVSILLGNGGGSLSAAPGSPFGVCSRPSSVAVADFDKDGQQDVAVTCADANSVSILMGHGSGTFTPNLHPPLAVGSRPSSLVLGDFNGDGNVDFAAANLLASTVSVSLGEGTGFFAPVTNYPVGRHPTSVALGDFNRDGRLDLVIADSLSHMVSVLLGKGDGTFSSQRTVAVESNPQSVAVGDFSGDGAADLAVANLNTDNVTVMLNTTDITPPTTSAALSPAPNANGWNKATVKVTLSATDNAGGSGVKELFYKIGANLRVVVSGSASVLTFDTEGAFSINYGAEDNAGNLESAHSLSVNIDETNPTITISQSPLPNSAGWNHSNVTVSFSCSDALSQVNTCTSPVSKDTEGANQVVTGSATDRAGNSTTAATVINLDKTPPALHMPVLAASYVYNASVTLTFGADDALSGLANSQATLNGTPIVSGTVVTLNHPGSNTFVLQAADVAGNTVSKTVVFSVLYNFTGFLPPILSDGTGVFKLGRTAPVKFKLLSAGGAAVSTAIAELTVQMVSGGVPVGTPIDATAAGSADSGNLFRYDGIQYIYNFDTTPLSMGTWQIQVKLDDGTVHTVLFGTK